MARNTAPATVARKLRAASKKPCRVTLRRQPDGRVCRAECDCGAVRTRRKGEAWEAFSLRVMGMLLLHPFVRHEN